MTADVALNEGLVAVGEATHIVTTHPRRLPTRHRLLRANNVIGKVITFSLFFLVWKGYELVVYDTARYLIEIRQRPVLGWLYRAQFCFFLSYLLVSFCLVYLAPSPKPVKDLPPAVAGRTVPFECTPDGQPARCFMDRCNGAFKSLRTRHCRDCARCQPGFDHHCPVVDSCVTRRTFKPFVCFLASVLPLIGFAEIPLIPLQLRAVRAVVAVTWDTAEMQEKWWRHWWTWLGGPTRYVIALVLGYFQYARTDPPPPLLLPHLITYTYEENGVTWAYDESPSPLLAVPTLPPLILCSAGALVFFIACAMLITVFANARRGFGTVQVERIRRWKEQMQSILPSEYDPRIRLWVPLSKEEQPKGGAVILIRPDEPIFDLGFKRNWRALMGDKWWHWFVPWIHGNADDLQMNPQVIQRLRQEARKMQ